jgi:hypothetical protein
VQCDVLVSRLVGITFHPPILRWVVFFFFFFFFSGYQYSLVASVQTRTSGTLGEMMMMRSCPWRVVSSSIRQAHVQEEVSAQPQRVAGLGHRPATC